jgi:hypothetical protein
MSVPQGLRAIPAQKQSTTAEASRTMDCFASLAMTNYRFRVRPIGPTGKSTKSCPALRTKIFRLTRRANQNYNSRHPVPHEGRWPSSRTLGWDAVDADVLTTNGTEAYGEVVWSRRPDAGVKSFEKQTLLRGDGDKKARSPRRARYKS